MGKLEKKIENINRKNDKDYKTFSPLVNAKIGGW